jgi:hypothetical protein
MYLQRGPPIAENESTKHRTHRTHSHLIDQSSLSSRFWRIPNCECFSVSGTNRTPIRDCHGMCMCHKVTRLVSWDDIILCSHGHGHGHGHDACLSLHVQRPCNTMCTWHVQRPCNTMCTCMPGYLYFVFYLFRMCSSCWTSTCVLLHACMHFQMCIYIDTHTHTHTHIHTYIHTCTYVHIYIKIIRASMHWKPCTYACTHKSTHESIKINVCIYVYIFRERDRDRDRDREQDRDRDRDRDRDCDLTDGRTALDATIDGYGRKSSSGNRTRMFASWVQTCVLSEWTTDSLCKHAYAFLYAPRRGRI